MKGDPLRQTVTEIETHCVENNVLLFHGWQQPQGVTSEEWQTDTSPDWKKFIGFFQQSGGKVLHLRLNELTEEELDAWQECLTGVSGKLRRDHSKRIKKLRNKIKHLTDYSLVFAHDGKVYEFTVDAAWHDELFTLRYGLGDGELYLVGDEEEMEE